ncbi:MAG TPA: hypothetical protein ENN07_06615 [candidate division Zixibacteria bacterium]|nr:hypothetical protein [candidate division Zixibacteria bacterium]
MGGRVAILLILLMAMAAIAEKPLPTTFYAEMNLIQMPDSLEFVRSDSSALQFQWAVRFRLFKDGLDAPDVFSLGIKYHELPGEGTFNSTVWETCSWGFERRSQEGTFYRIGDMMLRQSDSSWVMSAEVNPFFLEGIDSLQLFGVTDCAPGGRFRLRDITDFGPPEELIWDRVGDISDRRFDIRWVRGWIEGLDEEETHGMD